MKNKIILFVLIFLGIMIIPVYASQIYISNDARVIASYPNNNFGSQNELDVVNLDGTVWSYIELPSINNTHLFIISPSGLPSGDHYVNKTFNIYNTSIFAEGTLKWNNKPALNELIGTYTYNCNWNGTSCQYSDFILSPLSSYIALVPNSSFSISLYLSSSESSTQKPYITEKFADIIPPSSVTNLQNTSEYTWINWTWTNPSDVDFNHNEIYINNTFNSNSSSTSLNLTGLTYFNTRTISIRSVDTTGNINTTWVNQTSTTHADNIYPASITNLQNTKSWNYINWTWTNPTDIDFNYSTIYINGIFIINSSSTHYNLTGLISNSTNIISIKTVDILGNINPSWVNQTVTTLQYYIANPYNMSTPYIENNFIKSRYSINVSLWKNPYFVWGNYYNNTGLIQRQECIYVNSNIFACDLLQGDYRFNMTFSSLQDYQNNITFYTTEIIIGNDTNSILNPTKLPKAIRESTLALNFTDYIFIIFIILLILYFVSFTHKDNDYDHR